MIAIYNGIPTPETDLRISPTSNGFIYGEGFFTTIKVQGLVSQNLDLHIQRILDSLSFFSFAIQLPNIENLISQSLALNGLTNARVKFIFFKDVTSISVLVLCQELVVDNTPVDLKISDFIRGDDPIFRYKSLNYYSNICSPLTIYKDHKNRVLETGFANIFMIIGKKIFTPPRTLPILPGTYRDFLLNKSRIGHYIINEMEFTTEELINADGVFITNSIKGIVPVNSIDHKTVRNNEIDSLIAYL